MVDVVTATKPITRNKLSQWLPNHEAVKALENLTADVGTTLPDAANASGRSIEVLQSDVLNLQAQVSALTASVSALQAEVISLQAQIDALTGSDWIPGALDAMRSQLQSALGAIDDINKGPL